MRAPTLPHTAPSWTTHQSEAKLALKPVVGFRAIVGPRSTEREEIREEGQEGEKGHAGETKVYMYKERRSTDTLINAKDKRKHAS